MLPSSTALRQRGGRSATVPVDRQEPRAQSPMPVSPAAPPSTRAALAVLFERSNFHAFQKPGAPSHYWAPLISACAGARRDEIFFLTPDDIQVIEGAYFFRLRAAAGSRHGGPAAPVRLVPVHPLLMRLGLSDFVEERRQRHPQERLFSEYKAGQEHAGLLFSRAFVQWIRSTAARLPEERRHLFADDFHFPSLRALFAVGARRVGVSETVARAIRNTEGRTETLADEERQWCARAVAEMARIEIETCFPPLFPYRELMA